MTNAERIDRNDKILAMKKDGKLNNQQIAKHFNVSPSNITHILKSHKATKTVTKKTPAVVSEKKPIAVVPVSASVIENTAPKHILRHVKKKAEQVRVNTDKVVITPTEIRNVMSTHGIRNYTKAKLVASILSPDAKVYDRTDDYDYTIAIGYREDMKALVISYARPHPISEDGTNKTYRKQGFAIAYGRLVEALETKKAIMSYDFPIRKAIKEDLADHIAHAKQFFKDKEIDSVYVYRKKLEGKKDEMKHVAKFHLVDNEILAMVGV